MSFLKTTSKGLQARLRLAARKGTLDVVRGTMAKVPFNVKRYVKRMVNAGEMLHFDTAVSLTPVTTAGTISKLTTVAQGDDINNRQGDQIKPFNFSMRLQVTTTTLGTGGYNNFSTTIVRIIVFQDKHGDSTPTVSGTTNTSILSAASIHSNFNSDTLDRYAVLYDKKHTLPQRFAATAFTDIHAVRFPTLRFKKVPMHNMEFADTTGVLPAKGQIYILAILDALSDSQVVGLTGYTRLDYKEK